MIPGIKGKVNAINALLTIACIPQAGSLLLKVYGVCSLQQAFLFLALPAIILVVLMYVWARKNGRQETADSIKLGLFAGLVATIFYDLARIPFLIFGQRVFAPISAYGVWLFDANYSTRFTELAGWAYHFVNGLSFGIIYSLFMRKQAILWAVLWACGLETIAFLSPFGRIFGFSSNPAALGIAYFGHFMYGLPLGHIVRKDDAMLSWLKTIPSGFQIFALLALFCFVIGQTIRPDLVTADSGAQSAQFRIVGDNLEPDWIRVDHGQSVRIVNTNPLHAKTIDVKKTGEQIEIPKSGEREFKQPGTGIFQLFVQKQGRTHSSFLMIEPVEQQN